LLDEDSKLALQVMFSYNSELAIDHTLKEKLLKITKTAFSSAEAHALLKGWINIAQNSGLKEFQKCADIDCRWSFTHKPLNKLPLSQYISLNISLIFLKYLLISRII